MTVPLGTWGHHTPRRCGSVGIPNAYEAAKSVRAGHDHPEPKQLDGVVEALRYVHAAGRSRQRAIETRVQIKSLLVTAPERIPARCRDHTVIKLIPALSPSSTQSSSNWSPRPTRACNSQRHRHRHGRAAAAHRRRTPTGPRPKNPSPRFRPLRGRSPGGLRNVNRTTPVRAAVSDERRRGQSQCRARKRR